MVLLKLPPDMDANAYALQASDPSQALGTLIVSVPRNT